MESVSKNMRHRPDEIQRLPKRIIKTALANGVIGVVVSVGLALWMAARVNDVASEHARSLFETAIQTELAGIALTTQDYAYWDLAYALVAARDDDGLYDNFGSGATESPTFDFIFLISADGVPIYGYASGGEASDLSVVDRALVRQLRPQLLELPLEPYNTLAAFTVIDGQVAAFAAGRIQPDDITGMTVDDFPMMVAGKWLSESRMVAIGEQVLLADVHLHTVYDKHSSDQNTHNHDQTTLDLTDINGQEIGHVSWAPPRPGSALLAAALPVVLGLSLLTLCATSYVSRAAAKQTAAFLREKTKARTDKLTGLMNRAGLDEMVNDRPVTDALERGHVAIIYLDLNGFKRLNDKLGHDAGDLALQILAERISGAVRENDHVVRLGGDEFLCLLIDPAPCQTASFMANRIASATQPHVRIGDDAHTVRPSLGVAVATPGIPWNQLLKNADRAMYRAKSQGTLEPVFYADGIVRAQVA